MLNKKDLMNLESIFMLSAVAQHTGKRRASKALNTSVDTINKYIDNLESDLGIKLLSSGGRGSALTIDGRRIVVNATKIKAILDDIYSKAAKPGEIRGEVRIAMNLAIRPILQISDMGSFYDKYPGLTLVSALTTEDPNFKDLSYDIAICRSVPDDTEVVLMHKTKVECGFFASSEYLAQKGYPRHLEDLLANHRLVNKNGSGSYIKNWRELRKRCNHVCYATNSTYDLVDVVRAGLGIGIMPLRYKNEGLVCLDNIPCESDLTFNLIARRNNKDIPKVRLVIDYYKSLMKKI